MQVLVTVSLVEFFFSSSVFVMFEDASKKMRVKEFLFSLEIVSSISRLALLLCQTVRFLNSLVCDFFELFS